MLDPTRRALLRGALAGPGLVLVSAGCTGEPPPTPPPVDPDDAVRAAAVQREQQLLAAYDTVLAAGGEPGLAALRDEHAVHLAALLPSSATPSPPAGASSSRPTAPLPDLRALERSAAAAHTAAVAQASRPLAALLAQLAASESSHVLAL